jgi:regulator of cell morphogenesis and NO signaling
MLTGLLKLSDVVSENPGLLLVLEHFKIPLGFGDLTVQEVCQRHQITGRLFLTICNLCCCKDALFIDAQRFDSADAHQVLKYLKASHAFFLNEKIPRLKLIIEQKYLESPADKYSRVIKKFVQDYATEVFEHMNYENTIVFPYVESLLQKQKQDSAYNINQFKRHHTNIEDKLKDLKNLLIKHVPPEYDSVVRRHILFELNELAHEINIHDYIENHLLIPLVEYLEK